MATNNTDTANHSETETTQVTTHVTKRTDRKKKTYMLHDPETMKSLGRFVSYTPRSAASKAASRGFKKILLRETGTKIVYEYLGDKVVLDPPKTVQRGERTVTFKTTSVVRSVGKTLWAAPCEPDDDAVVVENPKA